MTGPGASGASRVRVAGIALLGVAAIAAVVGLISIGGEGSSSAPAAMPPTTAMTSSAAPAPGQDGAAAGQAGAGQPGAAAPGAPTPGAAPPVTEALPPVAVGAPIVPGGSSSGGTGGGGGSGGGGVSSFAGVPVRVYNNSMIVGLAEKAGGQMRAQGWDVVETGNYSGGTIPVSTAYYRPGTGEEGAAQAIAAQWGLRAEPRFPGIAGASPGVIVIATNNWGQNQTKGS